MLYGVLCHFDASSRLPIWRFFRNGTNYAILALLWPDAYGPPIRRRIPAPFASPKPYILTRLSFSHAATPATCPTPLLSIKCGRSILIRSFDRTPRRWLAKVPRVFRWQRARLKNYHAFHVGRPHFGTSGRTRDYRG